MSEYARYYRPSVERPDPRNPERLLSRVVVTGIGLATPIGGTVPETMAAFYRGDLGASLLEDPFTIVNITGDDGTKITKTMRTEIHVVGQLKDFDPPQRLAGILPQKEIRRLARVQQFGLAGTREAAERAGVFGANSGGKLVLYPEVKDRGRLGVVVGTGVGGLTLLQTNTIRLLEGKPLIPREHVIPAFPEETAGIIGQIFELHGPQSTLTTACSSGQAAISEAFMALAHGDADAIVAVGVEAANLWLTYQMFRATTANTSSADPLMASIPLDERRSGFVQGEGVGVLILETREFAARRHARILAEVRGHGNVQGWGNNPADPSKGAVKATLHNALDMAGEPETDGFDLISFHATSTKGGDPEEADAVRELIEEREAQGQPLRAVAQAPKRQLTHTIGAAGAVETAVSILQMNDGMIAGTPEPDGGMQLIENMRGIEFPTKTMPGQIRRVINSSNGFGGQNRSGVYDRPADEEARIEEKGRIFTAAKVPA